DLQHAALLPPARRSPRRSLAIVGLRRPATAVPELVRIEHSHASTLERDHTTLLLLAKDAVHRRTRRPGHRGEILLCERDDAGSIGLGELGDPPPDTRLGI